MTQRSADVSCSIAAIAASMRSCSSGVNGLLTFLLSPASRSSAAAERSSSSREAAAGGSAAAPTTADIVSPWTNGAPHATDNLVGTAKVIKNDYQADPQDQRYEDHPVVSKVVAFSGLIRLGAWFDD